MYRRDRTSRGAAHKGVISRVLRSSSAARRDELSRRISIHLSLEMNVASNAFRRRAEFR
jgi:hypothetical protein